MSESLCQICKTPFHTQPNRISNGRGKFCSVACYRISQRQIQPIVLCLHCAKTFVVRPITLKRGQGKFCSIECFRLYYTDRHMPSWQREERHCLHCHRVFEAKAAKLREGRGKFCSKDCFETYRRQHIDQYSIPIEERFWLYVDICAPHECWLWLGAKQNKGYGAFHVPGITSLAHRFAYIITYGPTPLEVMHQCDNPPCVNPRHLRAGTHQENMQEAAARNRLTHHRKLTPEQVRFIRENQCLIPTRELATMFHVSTVAINCVLQRRTYKYIE